MNPGERNGMDSEGMTGSSAGGPVSKQRIIKIHEEMLIKITKNGSILRPETFKFYSQKVMRKQLYDVHIYRTQE